MAAPRKPKYDLNSVADKLREFYGNVAAVGRAFGVTRQAMHLYIQAHPELAEVAHECRETMKDNVESVLYSRALAGEAWAVNKYLSCQARERGYSERVEVTGAAGGPVEVREVVVTTREQAEAVLAHLPGPGGVPG